MEQVLIIYLNKSFAPDWTCSAKDKLWGLNFFLLLAVTFVLCVTVLIKKCPALLILHVCELCCALPQPSVSLSQFLLTDIGCGNNFLSILWFYTTLKFLSCLRQIIKSKSQVVSWVISNVLNLTPRWRCETPCATFRNLNSYW